MPSATARGGGVFYPIVRSLSEAFGSQPGPSSRKIGAYLMQVGYHTDATTCMMFLTSMAGNPLCVGLAASAVGVEITWTNWALAAIVPGLISLALVPWVVSLLSPPEIKAIPNARELAEKELAAMGPMSKDEKVLAFVFVMCLVLWATGSWTHLGATPIAMLAIAIMLIAKDTAEIIGSAGLGWIASFLIVILFYTYSHYCFASVTARISAMYAAFVAVAAACGTPALMAALTFGFFANCPISLTHYGNGCGPVYFGAGYVSQGEWWRNGFVICTMNVVIWLTIGMAWWKVIGLY